MKIFNLPDLGEGLPDATIREWYVKVGDEVTADQPIAAMETAKALVDVPSPQAGIIKQLFGNPGDIVETGQPLIGFVSEAGVEEVTNPSATDEAQQTETTSHSPSTQVGVKAAPRVRKLAKELGVDLSQLVVSGDRITSDDVQRAAQASQSEQFTTLSSARRAMVMSMSASHQEIVPVTINDDADIQAWSDQEDVTVRLLRAIERAVTEEPMLNVNFDSKKMAFQKREEINIGLAIDTAHGLYVPVIKNVANLSDQALRNAINQFKQQAQERAIAQDDLYGATIMLSNFGSIAGRYANPILVAPSVAIIGVGRSRPQVVVDNQGDMVVHTIMPISLTVDHRIITGGEAARFLRSMLAALQE